jgi:hypothetical protein
LVGWTGLAAVLAASCSATAAGLPAKSSRLAPCARLASYARTLTHVDWTKGDKVLSPVLKFAKGVNVDQSAPAAPGSDAALVHSLIEKKAFEDPVPGYIEVEHAPKSDLVRASLDEGTLHCQTLVFARSGPRDAVRLVDAPASAGEELCWMTNGDLATLDGRPAFVVHDFVSGIGPDDHIIVTPWTGTRWGEACETDLHFDTTITLTERYCDDKDVCARAGRVAHAIVAAYNRHSHKAKTDVKFTYGPKPPDSVQALIAQAPNAAGDSFETPDFPTFGAKAEDHPLSYGEFAYFPLKLGGAWYGAAIAREGVGWREGDNTLLIIYDLKSAMTKPLASFVLPVSVTRLASAKAVTPKPPEPR